MPYGLKKDEELQEITEKVDENTAIKYRVAKEKIDIKKLKDELTSLKATPKPTDEELIEEGKGSHYYYDETRQERIDEIEAKLAEVE